ncbi:MAG: hypothetical protein RLZZ471_314 [Actinomycetota bacterium]|jgi:DHA1 family bicyclomycin/chloramphenicol resistance-like MFS transporter
MLRSKTPTLTTGLIATLGLIAILGPFGSDAYLPALPIIAKELGTSAAGVQSTLSAFMIGMAFGQLLMGSFSDARGRRLLIILGCTIMGLACFIAGAATSLITLLIACALIGFSSSTGMVVGRALISDLATGLSASRAFSLMGLFAGIGPIAGPIGGAFALTLAGWRWIFFALGILSLLLASFAFVNVPETLPKEKRQSANPKSMAMAAVSILRNRLFLQNALILWATASMLFAYISSSPFIVQGILGFTPFAYTVVFGLNGVGLMIAGAIAGAVAKRVSPRRVIGWGVTLQLVAAGVLVTTWITQSPSAWNILPALFLLVSAMGFMFGPATALALTQVRQYGGTALAVQGSIQFLIASVMATAVGLAGPHEFWPLALIVLLASLVSLTFWIRSKKSLVEVL